MFISVTYFTAVTCLLNVDIFFDLPRCPVAHHVYILNNKVELTGRCLTVPLVL